MIRTIEYTVSLTGVTPRSPQFAGVQGENGVSVIRFTPDNEFADAVSYFAQSYDMLKYRVDCIDGAGRNITGEVLDYSGRTVDFPLTNELTKMGGKLSACLIISGVNNDSTQSAVLYSFPVSLYFKEFPIVESFSDKSQLNKAVEQVKRMREETYDIFSNALDENLKIAGLYSKIKEESEATKKSADDCETYLKTIMAVYDNCQKNEESAASHAATSLTYSINAASYANTAKAHADLAEQRAEECTETVNGLLSVVGDINAVLATIVE